MFLPKTTLALGALFATVAHAVTPLEVRGSNFVNSVNGDRFQMIGMAYQPGGASGYNPGTGKDPLSDGTICLRDAILMQRLGVNTIRVYNLDPDVDHTECASIFNAAGIYMILDVNSPLENESLNRVAPWENYNEIYMERCFKIVEAFKNFPNLMGFFSANEIINEDGVPQVPEYVRAVTRDLKDYIRAHSSRTIPVGYSAADVRTLLRDSFDYFSCNLANETQSSMDFFGVNSYSWCGESSFTTSGYDVLTETFADTPVPIFFSEYGCIKVTPRVWTENQAIYSSPMAGVFSGGIVYEFTEEPNNYGLVEYRNDDVVLKTDYDNLMSQNERIDLTALAGIAGLSGNTAPSCTSVQIASNITGNFEVPARLDEIEAMIRDGVSGTYPTGVRTITSTDEPSRVIGSNGQEITGLKLNILASDESNLPGNNQSGGGSGSGNGTGGGNDQNAAGRLVGGTNSKIAAGAVVAFTLWSQL